MFGALQTAKLAYIEGCSAWTLTQSHWAGLYKWPLYLVIKRYMRKICLWHKNKYIMLCSKFNKAQRYAYVCCSSYILCTKIVQKHLQTNVIKRAICGQLNQPTVNKNIPSSSVCQPRCPKKSLPAEKFWEHGFVWATDCPTVVVQYEGNQYRTWWGAFHVYEED